MLNFGRKPHVRLPKRQVIGFIIMLIAFFYFALLVVFFFIENASITKLKSTNIYDKIEIVRD